MAYLQRAAGLTLKAAHAATGSCEAEAAGLQVSLQGALRAPRTATPAKTAKNAGATHTTRPAETPVELPSRST